VQKMSKSLGNAIGINEPPAEMYGKLMSINDELMWKYWVFLTDLKQSEIEKMRADVAAGIQHPMWIKKRLAGTITAGFHGEKAATIAEENWSWMFQQKGVAEDLEEISVAYSAVAGSEANQVRLPKLLVALGLAASNAEANRKIAEKAVRLEGESAAGALVSLAALPARIGRPSRQARQSRGDCVGAIGISFESNALILFELSCLFQDVFDRQFVQPHMPITCVIAGSHPMCAQIAGHSERSKFPGQDGARVLFELIVGHLLHWCHGRTSCR